jgi:hypothetical protein
MIRRWPRERVRARFLEKLAAALVLVPLGLVVIGALALDFRDAWREVWT